MRLLTSLFAYATEAWRERGESIGVKKSLQGTRAQPNMTKKVTICEATMASCLLEWKLIFEYSSEWVQAELYECISVLLCVCQKHV